MLRFDQRRRDRSTTGAPLVCRGDFVSSHRSLFGRFSARPIARIDSRFSPDFSRQSEGRLAHRSADHKVNGQIRTQLDGIVIGPAMVALARAGIFDQLERGPVDTKEHRGESNLSQLFIGAAGNPGLDLAPAEPGEPHIVRSLRRANCARLWRNGFLSAAVYGREHPVIRQRTSPGSMKTAWSSSSTEP